MHGRNSPFPLHPPPSTFYDVVKGSTKPNTPSKIFTPSPCASTQSSPFLPDFGVPPSHAHPSTLIFVAHSRLVYQQKFSIYAVAEKHAYFCRAFCCFSADLPLASPPRNNFFFFVRRIFGRSLILHRFLVHAIIRVRRSSMQFSHSGCTFWCVRSAVLRPPGEMFECNRGETGDVSAFWVRNAKKKRNGGEKKNTNIEEVPEKYYSTK